MPLQTTKFVIEDEIARLEAERRELADAVADLDPDNPMFETTVQEGNRIDQFLSGLEYARTEWDVESVTLIGLTGGEIRRMKNHLDDEIQRQQLTVRKNWREAVYVVAFGTAAAPYVDDSMNSAQRIDAVDGELPDGYLAWAEQQINDLSTVGNERRVSFSELVMEKRQTSAETTTSTSS